MKKMFKIYGSPEYWISKQNKTMQKMKLIGEESRYHILCISCSLEELCENCVFNAIFEVLEQQYISKEWR